MTVCSSLAKAANGPVFGPAAKVEPAGRNNTFRGQISRGRYHGHPQKFFKEATSIFCLFFSVCRRCNVNGSDSMTRVT